MSNLPQQVVGWFKSHFSKSAEPNQKSKGDIRKDLKWMFPPSDPHSANGWDLFWKNQFEHDVAGFCDLMVHSHQLVEAAQRLNLKAVLYVGPGASLEPFALARAGFAVTALDISPVVGRLGKWMLEHAAVTDEDCERFLSRNSFRDGGTVEYVVGDLFDQAICPGPYDVIVERKTIQDYPESDQIIAVQRLLQRLAPAGIYLAHCHDNRWNPIANPGSEPYHATSKALSRLGIQSANLAELATLDRQMALHVITTG